MGRPCPIQSSTPPRIISIIYQAFATAYIPIANAPSFLIPRRVLRPFYEEESEDEGMIGVQIKASLVQCDRSLVKDFRSKLRGILVATKERRMIAFAFEIILSSSSHATPYSFSLNLHSKGDSFQEDFTLPTGTRSDGFALRGFFNSISWSSLTKNRESVTNFQWFPSL